MIQDMARRDGWWAIWTIAAVLAVALAGCGQPAEPARTSTPVVGTRVPATSTPHPATPAPAVGLTQVGCQNQARFIEDLTIPDGSQVEPGVRLDKRWSVLNSGTCDWGPGYRLVRTDPGTLGGPAELALYPARAGESAVWQVVLTAPSEPGQHIASWQARSPGGQLFGDEVFVLVEVEP